MIQYKAESAEYQKEVDKIQEKEAKAQSKKNRGFNNKWR